MTPAVAPERTYQQRLDALRHANDVRIFRAQLKVDVFQARVDADAVLLRDEPRLSTMKAFELALAVPGVGYVKTNKIFGRLAISPSKSVGGLTVRQRQALAAALAEAAGRSHAYRVRRAIAVRDGTRVA